MLAASQSLNFRDWSGYYAASSFETSHEHEYHAIRHAAALIDVSPLFKYLISGPDAVRLVDRVITRDAYAIVPGQVAYTPWCDERGNVIDDGTVTRVREDLFRWTAADPSLRWLQHNAAGLNVRVEDASERVAALALQGPAAGAILHRIADAEVRTLKYYRMTSGTIANVPVDISRTGYTGDLGYEIWMPWDRAVEVWDAIVREGEPFGVKPVGMLALDVARVEAGLLLIDVDYHGSHKALTESQQYSPYELNFDRLVRLDAGPFVGREALRQARRLPVPRRIVGLVVDWPSVEQLFEAAGLPPQLPSVASRVSVPVFRRARQIGKATTTAWSPTLKKLIALATVAAPDFEEGTTLEFELTVEAVRHRVPATVVKTPFFNPARKTATPVNVF
jgi:aminomethyltransferase